MAMKMGRKRVKICLFGETAVGKTSLIRRYVENMYDDKYILTLGTKVSKKTVAVVHPDKNTSTELTMMIWDIMGQKGLRMLLQEAYFDGASAAIGVCDITRKSTLDDLAHWIEGITKVAGEIPMIILANKYDLKSEAVIDEEDLKNFVNTQKKVFSEERVRLLLSRGKTPYLFTSAKTGENVNDAFYTLAEWLL